MKDVNLGLQTIENIDDETLALAYHGGSTVALNELCRRYEPLILKHAHSGYERILGDDLLGELWVVFIDALASYDLTSPIPLAGYMASKIRYGCYNYFKKCRNRWRHEVNIKMSYEDDQDESLCLEAIEAMDDTEFEALMTVNREEQARMVYVLLLKLEPMERDILYRFFYCYHSMAEIADSLGVTRQTVHYHYSKSLKKLRSYLGLKVNPCVKK